MFIYSAPMEGVTGAAWRRAHAAVFGGVDKYFTPFFSPTHEHIFPPRTVRELLPANNPGLRLVPQLLCRDPDDFVWAAGELLERGYGEVNFNLGCPSGTVAAKGKGSGLLAFPDELERFFSCALGALPERSVSVKTRLGVASEGEYARLLDIYAPLPLRELIVHPRVRLDGYTGGVHLEAFAETFGRISVPVVYNGDVFTPGRCGEIAARFPRVGAVMLGRGLAANPALAREICGGAPASREELRRFHTLVWEGCVRDFGSAGPAVHRLKELWSYLIHMFSGCEKQYKTLRKAKRPEEFLAAAESILSGAPLAERPAYGGEG